MWEMITVRVVFCQVTRLKGQVERYKNQIKELVSV